MKCQLSKTLWIFSRKKKKFVLTSSLTGPLFLFFRVILNPLVARKVLKFSSKILTSNLFYFQWQSVILEAAQVPCAVLSRVLLTPNVTRQVPVTSACVPAALILVRRCVDRMERPTKTRVNWRSVLARRTNTLKWFHTVDAQVTLKDKSASKLFNRVMSKQITVDDNPAARGLEWGRPQSSHGWPFRELARRLLKDKPQCSGAYFSAAYDVTVL